MNSTALENQRLTLKPNLPVCSACMSHPSLSHCLQMRKKVKSVHAPHLLPLPSRHVPVSPSHRAHPVSFVAAAARIDTLQWKQPLRHVKGSRLQNAFPAAPAMMSLRNRGNGGKLLALPATSVESVRSLVGSRLRIARIGPAGMYLFFVPFLCLGSFFSEI